MRKTLIPLPKLGKLAPFSVRVLEYVHKKRHYQNYAWEERKQQFYPYNYNQVFAREWRAVIQ